MFMKLYFSFFIFFVFFASSTLMSKEISAEYNVKTKGLSIGTLIWKIETNEQSYKTLIDLKHRGFITAFYKFKGDYVANGSIIGGNLYPKKYTQNWVTNSKKRKITILFENKKIKSLTMKPVETEVPRIEYEKLNGYKDPLSSFLVIILNNSSSYTIDGRRTYLLFPEEKKGGKKILIKEYKNIWADHKRNDLEYLQIFKDESSVLPKKINIKFKGSVFSLIKI